MTQANPQVAIYMALELSSKSWKIALSNAQKLVQMLMRYHRQGERTLWRVVRVPSQAEEDERRPHRERERLLGERTSHRNRLRGLLALHGVRVKSPVQLRLRELRDVGGQALPSALVADCEREAARLALLEQA